MADVWRKRREAKDRQASQEVEGAAPQKRAKAKAAFTKMDLTALIISKQLYTTDGLLAYVQQHGTAAMQTYVNRHQRRLAGDIEDAREWDSAQERAAAERVSDWELLLQRAQQACPHEARGCSYRVALREVLERNHATLNGDELASALRDVLVNGPSKTTRVPFLVGPSNTGKSTILYPFDDVFTPAQVLHKPALGSSFALRNLVGGKKRFIFWDDFRPVEYAHEKTVPVSLFLSLFIGQSAEIQVSQAFNDGNKDIQWKRGVVFTAKQEGLWKATAKVSDEDVRHMRNRVQEFVFAQPLGEGTLKEVTPCASCMAQWIVGRASARDAAAGLRPSLPVQELGPQDDTGLSARRVDAVLGFAELLQVVRAPVSVAKALLGELEELGAISVSELTLTDWQSLQAWALLLPLQQRRLSQHVGVC